MRTLSLAGMSAAGFQVPGGVPVLSAGRHRSPRRGACFMEFASFLAGEKWSDHPACTHRTLAALARDVNDLTTDAARPALLPLVHRVVGLTSDDPRVAAAITARAAASALSVATMERQRALAAGLLNLAHQHEWLTPLADEALEFTPDARRWGLAYLASTRDLPRAFDLRSADAIIHTSTMGIAFACYSPADAGPDVRLNELLQAAIEDAERIIRPAVPAREHALQLA